MSSRKNCTTAMFAAACAAPAAPGPAALSARRPRWRARPSARCARRGGGDGAAWRVLPPLSRMAMMEALVGYE